MLLHVSAANCSHPQGATGVEMYRMLYRLSNINGKYLYILVASHKSTVFLKLNYSTCEVKNIVIQTSSDV